MKDLLNEFDHTMKALLKLISSFSSEQLNKTPFEGSWTAGQVAQHVLLSSNAVLKALQGPAKETLRQPDAGIEKLKGIFLDFNTKLNSPDFIVPENKVYDKEQLSDALAKTASEIAEIIKTSDLSETCLNTPEVLGELTRLELIRFVIYHTQRHHNQLTNIYRRLVNE